MRVLEMLTNNIVRKIQPLFVNARLTGKGMSTAYLILSHCAVYLHPSSVWRGKHQLHLGAGHSPICGPYRRILSNAPRHHERVCRCPRKSKERAASWSELLRIPQLRFCRLFSAEVSHAFLKETVSTSEGFVLLVSSPEALC